MSAHLHPEEITEALLQLLPLHRQAHLQSCDVCRKVVAGEQGKLAALRLHVEKAAERPETFWARQRLVIGARVEHKKRYRTLAFAWSTAAAALLLFVFWMGNGEPPLPPANAPRLQAVATDSDEALLAAMQDALQQEVPSALRPAQVLTDEVFGVKRHAVSRVQARQTAKENR